MVRWDRGKAAVVFAAVATAQPGIAAPLTVQQQFDAAQAAADAGQPGQARDLYDALLQRLPSGSMSRARFLVEARLGAVLIALGQPERAEALLGSAITGLAKPDPADLEERTVARYYLARALEMQGRSVEAAGHYRTVVEAGVLAAGGSYDVRSRLGLARMVIISQPDEARAMLDALLALPPDSVGGRDDRALLKMLRGRVELNDGQPASARRWFSDSARAAGGATTTSVNMSDVRIRSDLTIANHLLGNQADVQKAIAYSGAGALTAEGLNLAASNELPDCAPLGQVPPDAMAIVEFSIADDGRAVGVSPIFVEAQASADLRAAIGDRFAQAVRSWRWNESDVGKLKAFWRQAVRVELRCLTARPDGDMAATMVASSPAVQDWLAQRQLAGITDTDRATTLPALRKQIAALEESNGPQSVALVPALLTLARDVTAPDADRDSALRRLMIILEREKAPPGLRATVGLMQVNSALRIDQPRATKDERLKRIQALADRLAADGPSDGLMLVNVRLGQEQERSRAFDAARTLYDSVISSPETLLSPTHPVRTEALLRRSNLAMRQADIATAARTLAATGLTPDQCAAVDVKPLPENLSVQNRIFPELAQRWRTGGFTQVAFDILPDGRTTNVRTVIASPPFAFSNASAEAAARFRYQPTFRPGGELGCAGSIQTFRFQQPTG